MKIEKVKKVYLIYMNRLNVIHIRNLKQALDHGLVLTKLHKIVKFKQKSWLKSYIDINTDLRKKAKKGFEKDYSN